MAPRASHCFSRSASSLTAAAVERAEAPVLSFCRWVGKAGGTAECGGLSSRRCGCVCVWGGGGARGGAGLGGRTVVVVGMHDGQAGL